MADDAKGLAKALDRNTKAVEELSKILRKQRSEDERKRRAQQPENTRKMEG